MELKRRRKLWVKMKMAVMLVTLAYANSQDISTCCEKATGACRRVCSKVSFGHNNITADTKEIIIEEKIPNIYKFCAPSLVEFWICINQTIQEVLSDAWWGQACCGVARSAPCRQACAGATNATKLTDFCRRSDEVDFFDCVTRQEQTQWCCSQTQSWKCHDACQKLLRRPSQSRAESGAKEMAMELCDESPELTKCLRDLSGPTTHVDTSKYISCCSESANAKCRSTCESVLKRIDDTAKIEEALVEDCGAPSIGNVLWQCFLKKDQPIETKDLIPYDVAKLHCCDKATTINCRRLCFQTFNNAWQSTWQKFHLECLSDPQEATLIECVEEVSAPCSLGCAGLTYCSQLNNRPTSLFRSCNAQADLGAHLAVAEQKGSGYVYISDMALPIKNSSQCPTDIWKSVACAMHVKPCTPKGHSSALCVSECARLVSACVEWGGARAPSARALCARLAPAPDSAPCVSLTDFIAPSPDPALLSAKEAVTSPCAGAKCGENQVCVVNRNCLQGDSCPKYTCVDGCRLGTHGSYAVPIGSWARIPMSLPTNKECFKVCNCTSKGFSHCQPLPCVERESCILHDKVVKHGEKYYMECNACVCAGGARVCAARACGARWPLPCACPPHHVPVRARHSLYPNTCLAKCSGATDAEISFRRAAACGGAPCAAPACLPVTNVCLSKLQAVCPQHYCVNTYNNCDREPPMPICDTDGRTHRHPCYLLKIPGKQMAYWGQCLKRCTNNDTVCGVNGVSYSSECGAWSEYVSIDYYGPCVAVGPISNTMEPKCLIDRVICPPLKKPNCLGFTPPGACCPKCGGGLRILYSQKQIDRALYGTNISASVINLQNILKALERHVKIAECALRGYLTIEKEIFVSVESLLENPTDLQLKVCVLEAEKISEMINRQSVFITSDLGLSALMYALPVHTSPSNSAFTVSASILSFLLPLTVLVSR